jgi:O-antigen ligase
MLHDHPLAGVGPGNFPSRVRAYDKGLGRRGAHNTVVAMFAETGWVGGTLFVALFVAGFAGAAATAWRGKAWRAPAAVAAGAALAGYLGAGMFVGRQTQVVAYALLGAVVALQSRYSTDA